MITLVAIALLGFSTTFAQTAVPAQRTTVATKTKVTTVAKKDAADAKTAVKKDIKTVKTSAKKTGVKLKADGTPDMRYSENKTTKVVTTGPKKKDGTLDMRYKANQKVVVKH